MSQCKNCGHLECEHDYGLFESPCRHKLTAEDWWEEKCHCKLFEVTTKGEK